MGWMWLARHWCCCIWFQELLLWGWCVNVRPFTDEIEPASPRDSLRSGSPHSSFIMGIISLTVTCGLLVASHWRREATKYARWIAFTGSEWRISCLNHPCWFPSCLFWPKCVVSAHQWCPSEFFQLTIPKLLPLGVQKLQTSPLGLIHGA